MSLRASRGVQRSKACQRLSPDEKTAAGGKRVRGALALEVMVEEREFEMLHIVFPRRFAPEIERSEFSAAVAPCSVRPRSHDQMARRCGTLPDHGPVEVPRPETILGVERPSDDQHGRLYVVAGPAQVARLPPCVVGGVFGKLFPERIGTLKFRKFGQRRMFPEERALVGAVRFDIGGIFSVGVWPGGVFMPLRKR